MTDVPATSIEQRTLRPRRQRILHVVGALVAGGAERSSKDLALVMKRAGMPVEFVALVNRRDEAGEAWLAEMTAAGIPVHVGPVPRLRPPTVLWLARLLRAPDIRIVHLHLDYTEVAYTFSRYLHRRKYGVLRKIHNTELSQGIQAWAFKHSDVRFYYSCGEAAHKAFLGHCKGEQVLIPNGLDFHWKPHDQSHREARQRELGLDPAFTHFVHVGSFRGASTDVAQKAQDVLIDAWKRSGAGAAACRLHFLGDGNLLDAHKALAAGDPSIAFHGVRPDVWRWLSACDVFCLPSRYEGLPLSGVEAIATGIPCIFSDIAPNRELRAEIAEFAPVGDAEALAACIRRWIGRHESASPAHVQWQRDRWGVPRVMQSFIEIYDRLMPPDGSGPIDPK
jgi:glycosyltransferase involved in cell wall biosynthesis